jgi:Domain of unknown function (DUF1906)
MRSTALVIITIVVALTGTVASGGRAATSAARAQAVVYEGYGLDTCKAPSTATLGAWLASPYRALGIYVGGVNRACGDGNLSASWVVSAVDGGWSLLPLYVGLQAPCVGQGGLKKIEPALANVQGAAAADDAVARAATFGLLAGTPIYFDMEAYKTTDVLCSLAVQDFVSAWVAEVHAQGYVAGVYGSAASTIRDLAALSSGAAPDAVWIANWNGKQSVFGDPYVPDVLWSSHQRLHQYRGGHVESYGGVTLTIDNNIVDAPVAGPGGVGPVAPIAPQPAPVPAPVPATGVGTVSSADGVVSGSWPDTAFTTAATVTLTPATLTAARQGFAAGSYLVQLTAQPAAGGAPIARFEAPVILHFGPLAPGLVPAYSADGSLWTPLARAATATVPAGMNARYTQAQDGSIDLATVVPGSFGLLRDVAAPARPTVSARIVRGALLLRWQPSQDNSGVVAGYRVDFGGKPVLTLAGTARRATIETFHPSGTSVFRVVAADSAANASVASGAVVVVRKNHPAGLPRPLPAWAWKLASWQAGGRHGVRPTTPRPVPAWYWTWADWRLQPFRIRS